MILLVIERKVTYLDKRSNVLGAEIIVKAKLALIFSSSVFYKS